MSLNWTVSEIRDWENVCYMTAPCDIPTQGITKGDRMQNPLTNALIWSTIAVSLDLGSTSDEMDAEYSHGSASSGSTGRSSFGPRTRTASAPKGLRRSSRWTRSSTTWPNGQRDAEVSDGVAQAVHGRSRPPEGGSRAEARRASGRPEGLIAAWSAGHPALYGASITAPRVRGRGCGRAPAPTRIITRPTQPLGCVAFDTTSSACYHAGVHPTQEGARMPTHVLSPDQFRAEAQRRLIDRYELMILLDLRSREAITRRIEKGKLPLPVIEKMGQPSLWDKDAIAIPD